MTPSVAGPGETNPSDATAAACSDVAVVSGITLLVIVVTRVQVTLLLGDLTSALASADADRVHFEGRLESFKVRRYIRQPFSSLVKFNIPLGRQGSC